MTERETIKQEIVTYVRRNGLPLRTERISRRVAIPPTMELHKLLAELVAENHLKRTPTLLVNGKVGHLYSAR